MDYEAEVKVALEESNDDRDRAVRYLVDHANDEMISALATIGAHQVINRYCSTNRERASSTLEVITSEHVAVAKRKLRAALTDPLNVIRQYRIWGGKFLFDATHDEILQSAEEHEKLSNTHRRSAELERRIASLFRSDQHEMRLRDVIGRRPNAATAAIDHIQSSPPS
jgi:cell division protein FtsB